MLVSRHASEAAFKELASGRGILHLATHGFFVDESCRFGTTEGAGPVPIYAPTENPLLRSGLVLAGANRRGDAIGQTDDGILTAEEIAGLDLSSAEWAVLSACNTGGGEWPAGEGVMGLRRAF